MSEQSDGQFILASLFGARWLDDVAKLYPDSQSSNRASWVKQWLLDPTSLTQRVQAVCTEGFNVKVLKHEMIPAPAEALGSLQLEIIQSVLHRQVLLCDGNTPLVFACSLLPESALTGDYAELKTLGSRPLGHWLFSEPVLKRAPMQYAQFEITELPGSVGSGVIGEKMAGRKTLFLGAEKPFMVSEFFLPSLASKLS